VNCNAPQRAIAHRFTGLPRLHPLRSVVPEFGLECGLITTALIGGDLGAPSTASKADVTALNWDLCFTPESGHQANKLACPLCAIRIR
jgi:hypothetical protein